MPVLERSREQRSRWCGALQLLAVVTEADDHGSRIDLAKCIEEDVHALVEEELAEVHDRRFDGREEIREAPSVALVGEALARVPRIRLVGARFSEQPLQPFVAVFRPE